MPKVESPEQVARLVDLLEAAGAPDHTRLWAMVENEDDEQSRQGSEE